MDLGFNPAPKPSHNRRVPKRGDRGKFSAKTIKEITERDNFQCVRCGSYRLESVPHHVIYRSAGGDNSKRNGVSICLNCHIEAHKYKKVRKWFEKYVEDHFDDKGDLLG